MYSDARGTCKIISADPRRKPALRFNYLSTEQDRREWVEAIRVTRAILDRMEADGTDGVWLDLSGLEAQSYYVGSSKTFEVFLIYEPDKERLKELALNAALADQFHARFPNKRKLVYAPCCYLEDWRLGDLGISFAQLPFEIYRLAA